MHRLAHIFRLLHQQHTTKSSLQTATQWTHIITGSIFSIITCQQCRVTCRPFCCLLTFLGERHQLVNKPVVTDRLLLNNHVKSQVIRLFCGLSSFRWQFMNDIKTAVSKLVVADGLLSMKQVRSQLILQFLSLLNITSSLDCVSWFIQWNICTVPCIVKIKMKIYEMQWRNCLYTFQRHKR